MQYARVLEMKTMLLFIYFGGHNVIYQIINEFILLLFVPFLFWIKINELNDFLNSMAYLDGDQEGRVLEGKGGRCLITLISLVLVFFFFFNDTSIIKTIIYLFRGYGIIFQIINEVFFLKKILFFPFLFWFKINKLNDYITLWLDWVGGKLCMARLGGEKEKY